MARSDTNTKCGTVECGVLEGEKKKLRGKSNLKKTTGRERAKSGKKVERNYKGGRRKLNDTCLNRKGGCIKKRCLKPRKKT